MSKQRACCSRGRVLVHLKTVHTEGTARPVRQAMAKQDEIKVKVRASFQKHFTHVNRRKLRQLSQFNAK